MEPPYQILSSLKAWILYSWNRFLRWVFKTLQILTKFTHRFRTKQTIYCPKMRPRSKWFEIYQPTSVFAHPNDAQTFWDKFKMIWPEIFPLRYLLKLDNFTDKIVKSLWECLDRCKELALCRQTYVTMVESSPRLEIEIEYSSNT